jgi:hypothetical protein
MIIPLDRINIVIKWLNHQYRAQDGGMIFAVAKSRVSGSIQEVSERILLNCIT